MANPEHVEILKQGVEAWNEWRKDNPEIRPDLSMADLLAFGANNFSPASYMDSTRWANLSGANLRQAYLYKANLIGANLTNVDLSGADLFEARLDKANLRGARVVYASLVMAVLSDANLAHADLRRSYLWRAHLNRANLSEANLRGTEMLSANLEGANLYKANLDRANLNGCYLNQADFTEANLFDLDMREASLARTNFSRAKITNCRIYGISAWDVNLEETEQKNLFINAENQPQITVDNLKVAQFIHLLLNNPDVREVIDTVTSKVVLILGRFTPERKIILDALREELKKRNYTPVLFDFEGPASRDITETVSTLAHMSRFVIADITDAKSIPQELMAIVPHLPSVPVQPLLLESQREYGMFEHFRRFPWVLPIFHYKDSNQLIMSLIEEVLEPAEAMALEQMRR